MRCCFLSSFSSVLFILAFGLRICECIMSLPWSSIGRAIVLPAPAILVAMSVILIFAIIVSMAIPLCRLQHLSLLVLRLTDLTVGIQAMRIMFKLFLRVCNFAVFPVCIVLLTWYFSCVCSTVKLPAGETMLYQFQRTGNRNCTYFVFLVTTVTEYIYVP